MIPFVARVPEWTGVIGVAAFLLGMLAATHFAKRRFVLAPEWSRKTMHVALGTSALVCPWLFSSAWPPIVIATMTIAVLVALRAGALGAQANTVVHGIARRSEGDLYFPIAAVMLFVLARGDIMLYTIPLLTLTLADPAAAVIGSRYGRARYVTLEDGARKSVEGSLSFFVVAFFTAHAPLMLFTNSAPFTSMLVAVTFAAVMTFVEASSWRGLDNLFVPVGGYLLLQRLLAMDARSTATLLVVILAISALVASVQRPARDRVRSSSLPARARSTVA